MNAPQGGWFATEWNWAHETGLPVGANVKGETGKAAQRRYYSPEPEGDSYTVAAELLRKYTMPCTRPDGSRAFFYHLLP